MFKRYFLSPIPPSKSESNPTVNLTTTKKVNQPPKTILYWTQWWNNPNWFFGTGNDVFSHCPVSNCLITDNSSMTNIQDFDAVLFHSWNLFTTGFQFPQHRSALQRWKTVTWIFLTVFLPQVYNIQYWALVPLRLPHWLGVQGAGGLLQYHRLLQGGCWHLCPIWESCA